MAKNRLASALVCGICEAWQVIPKIRYECERGVRQHHAVEIGDPELDPRLAALYDEEQVWSDDDDFFLKLVNRAPGRRIVDVGCGTGRLTVAMAMAGHRVTGVDPNPSFLAIAQAKSSADKVSWIRGTTADLPTANFDVALMTSHVAQVFLTDEEWAAVLADLKGALVPDGFLAFDTRDPAAKAWESWGGGGRSLLADGLVVDNAIAMSFQHDIAMAEHVMAFSDGSRPADEVRATPLPGTTWAKAQWGYRFRTPDHVQKTVEAAGFTIESVYGGWHQEPLGEGVGEIVVIARA